MAEYIERDTAIDAVVEVYCDTPSINMSSEKFEAAVRKLPAADVVSIEVLKKWLYENALNNAGSSYGFACVEISKRLDGLRRYAKEGKE